jgi:hypothetical protein
MNRMAGWKVLVLSIFEALKENPTIIKVYVTLGKFLRFLTKEYVSSEQISGSTPIPLTTFPLMMFPLATFPLTTIPIM